MEMKYLAIIGVVIFILAIIGATYGYQAYSDNKYYENYRLATYYGDKVTQTMNDTENYWNSTKLNSMKELNDLAKNCSNQTQKTKEYASQYQYYVNEMLKYADSDIKKQYAESMLKQSNATLNYIDYEIKRYTWLSNSNEAQLNSVINKLSGLNKDEAKFITQMTDEAGVREKIRAQYPDFTKRLDQEYDSSKNATLT